MDLETFKLDISIVESSLQKKSASEMSRLERSMASTHILAFSKDPTQPVASFISYTRLCLLRWIEQQATQFTGDEACIYRKEVATKANIVQTDLELIRELTCYIRDVFDVTQFAKPDDGSFQTYLAIGNETVAQALECEVVHDLAKAIGERLDVFKVSSGLTSGHSMENLWSVFAPPTAKNASELDLVLRCEKVADLFDDIKWRSKMRLDILADLRDSVTRLDPLAQYANSFDEGNLMVSRKAHSRSTCSLTLTGN